VTLPLLNAVNERMSDSECDLNRERPVKSSTRPNAQRDKVMYENAVVLRFFENTDT
jgi:hypothetical protein